MDAAVDTFPLRDSKAVYAAEQDVVAGCLREPDRLNRISLEPRHFTSGPNRRVWESLLALHAEGEPIDIVTVMERLEDAGYREDCTYLGELMANCLDSNWEHKARMLFKHGEKVHFWTQLERAFQTRDEAEIVRIGEEIQLRMAEGSRRAVLAPVGTAYQSMVEEWAASRSRPKLTWGIAALDRHLKPMEPTRLHIVAARPRMGKTAMAVHVALANAKAGRKVGIISLEQSMEELTARLLCNLSGCCYEWVRGEDQVTDHDARKIADAKMRLCDLPIIINDATPLTIGQLSTYARSMVQRHGCELLIVDYVQKIGGKAKERHMEIAYVAMGLKDIARQLKVPVLALAQANRDAEGKRPSMSDIRDSGFIEQEADQIIAIHRDQTDDGELSNECELLVLKNRHGRGDMLIRTHYRGECFRFEELDRRYA